MSGYQYLTPEGLEKLKQELNFMKTKGRADIASQIQEAREKGDISENAEYDAAKEAQGMLELRISELAKAVNAARLIDGDKLDASKVLVLSTVEIRNQQNGQTMKFTLVAESEANTKEGKLSVTSPIGKGLLGKKAGEVAEVRTPNGVIKFKVLSIKR